MVLQIKKIYNFSTSRFQFYEYLFSFLNVDVFDFGPMFRGVTSTCMTLEFPFVSEKHRSIHIYSDIWARFRINQEAKTVGLRNC